MKTIKAEVTWEYNDNGQLEYEQYCIDGKLHNPNGPAYQSWFDNGQLRYESYRIDGKRHNPNGPAHQCWYNNGQLRYEEYWIDGKQLTKKEFENRNNSCNGKVIEIEGKKYKLQEID